MMLTMVTPGSKTSQHGMNMRRLQPFSEAGQLCGIMGIIGINCKIYDLCKIEM